MIDLQESLLRRCLRPKVECDLPGRLRLRFARHALLPEDAKPYLHYVEDVLKLLPGVHAVQLNPRIGTILVLYDAGTASARHILRWVDIVVDTGLEIARVIKAEDEISETDLAEVVRARLLLRLPHM